VKKGRRKKAAAAVDPKEPKAVGGQLLNARSLERSATHIKNPTALRVLMVLAAYANDDGFCWPCQDDIGARLGVRREHVNKAMTLLESEQCIFAKGEKGRRKTYQLNREGLELERVNEDDVQAARQARREKRKGKFDPEVVAKKPGSGAGSSAEQFKQDDRDFAVGRRVAHSRYGRGRVLQRFLDAGTFRTTSLDVGFDNHGLVRVPVEECLPVPDTQAAASLEAIHSGPDWIGKTVCDKRSGKTGVIVRLDGEPGNACRVWVGRPNQTGCISIAIGHLQMVAAQ
jgi:hypothetical protein